ncbi:hypothetical protein CBR_g53532 [Chara braunii]|uniref:Reverse transcriptase domain-containing protein n=1 Tax=Chara braunii TaxID=69332 RepID=A0A388MAX5_CHABU|nr:hypothetical protein CBR_g53532 [Chara braunii]|eukprot:GBG91718.1 hypothetical protein CBR_g53532 [Chara braunii]
MMLRCTFCNKVFQGTQCRATRHFVQTNYCKDVSDEALYEIARRTQQRFESYQMERVGRYEAKRGLNLPRSDSAMGGEAGQSPVEGGGGGDGVHGCGYVLPWQRDEGMLDCQARLEEEPVRMGTRKGMPQEEIAQQVALIMRDPIRASAPPSADAVFDRRACIFRPYTRDDDSNEERAPEAADDLALPIPPEIDETHEDPDNVETRTYTTRRVADRAEREMMGGDEDCWGPFGEVASIGDVRDDRVRGSHAGTSRAEAGMRTPTPMRQASSIPPPPAPSPAPPSHVSPLQPATTAAEMEELASSLPQHGLQQRSTVLRQLRLQSSSPGVLQEEVGHRATQADWGGPARAEEEVTTAVVVEGEVAAVEEEVLAVATGEEEVPVGAAVEGEIEAAAEGEEEVALAAVVSDFDMEHDGEDANGGGDDAKEHLMQQFITEELDPIMGGFTPGVVRSGPLAISAPAPGLRRVNSEVEAGLSSPPETAERREVVKSLELGASLSRVVEEMIEGTKKLGVARGPKMASGERQASEGQRAGAEVRVHRDVGPRVPVNEGVTEDARGVPVESRWADLMDAEARMGEAQGFSRDRQGYRALTGEEEECQDRRDLREGRSAEAGGRPQRWVERIPEVVTGWRNDREIGGNRGSDWGISHWKDARDGRWGDTPQARTSGPRPEVRAPPPPAPPAPTAATTQGGSRLNNPQARSGCVYCNEEKHIKRDCPYLTEALRLGVVKLNEHKWVVWGDTGEAVSFYPSMKVNVDKRMAFQEARLGKKPAIGSSSNTVHIQMTESPGGVSIREPQVSSIKFIETNPEEERPCLGVRTQVGTETSESQGSVTEGTEVRSGDNDQPMADAKAVEEKKEEPTSPKSPKKRGPKKFQLKCTLNEIDTVAPLRRTLMQPMQCTLLEYLAASKSAREELLSITRKVRVPLARGPTVPVEGPAKEEVQASRITIEELPANFFSGEEAKKFYVVGSSQLQAVVSGKKMRALVDNGSESTVCRDSIVRELGLEIDRGVSMSMVVADNKLQPVEGVCHSPVIEVAGVEATVPIFSVKECSSELILGRTWLSAVHATTVDLSDGSRTLSIQSPDGIRVVLKTVDAQDERNQTRIARRKGSLSRVCRVRLEEVPLTDRGPKGDQLEVVDVGDKIVINAGGVKKHKTVAEKVKPAAVSRDRTGEATISEEEIVDIIRKRKEIEGQRITTDRLAKMDIGDGNLTEEEKGFIAMTLRGCDKAIAFDDSKRGRIDPRYAKPTRIHTVPHMPWKDRPQWKYAQKEKEEIIAFIKEKIRTFVAEPCESAYSNKWFFLRKGGNNKLRWIQNLQGTNSVTIRDVESIPEADLLAKGSAGRSIYSICDLFLGYDGIPLDYRDRHMTTMHTPLRLVKMMVVPMGWTNGVAVFQRAMIAVLKEFIPKKVEVFLDDFPIKRSVERDETEVLPGVRKFVVDHMSDVRDVLVKLDDANLTVSGTKSRGAYRPLRY